MFYLYDEKKTTKGNGSWTPTTHTYTDAFILERDKQKQKKQDNQDVKGWLNNV